MIKCLKTDLYRALVNIKFVIVVICISIVGYLQTDVTGVLDMLALKNGGSIFDSLYIALVFSQFGILVFIFLAAVFSDCLCDDLNYKNYLYSVIRSGKNEYIVSKIITVIISTVLAFFLGMCLYAITSSLFFGFEWNKSNNQNVVLEDLSTSNLFKGLVEGKKYVTIFVIMILFQSLLYCITSLFSMLVSLYIKNKLLVLCVPGILITVGNYIVSEKIPNYSGYIFVYMLNHLQQSNWIDLVLQRIVPTFGIITVLAILIVIKFRRDIVD